MKKLNDFETNFSKIKITYTGDSLFYLIIYTGYDDFLSHDIYAKVQNKKDGLKIFNKETKKSSIINGCNIYNYKEIFKMYKWIDSILIDMKNISEWVEIENKMLNKFGFNIEEIKTSKER